MNFQTLVFVPSVFMMTIVFVIPFYFVLKFAGLQDFLLVFGTGFFSLYFFQLTNMYIDKGLGEKSK